MNREIKFRAWHEEAETMLQPGDDFGTIHPLDCCEYFQGGQPVVLLQYTGLKDKNGTEIYEGDIVRWDDMTNGTKWRVAIVELNPALQFRVVRIKCDFVQSAKDGHIFEFGRFIYKDTHNHLEVIGNIYENPDLISK